MRGIEVVPMNNILYSKQIRFCH